MYSKIVITFIFLFSTIYLVSAQEDLIISSKDSVVTSSWMFGLGYTIADDSGDVFDNLLNVKETWNAVPYPSRLSIGRYFKSGLGIEAIAAYSKYQQGKRVDGIYITEDKNYYSIDSRLSYDLNKLVGQTGFFDPYVGVGLGYTMANDQQRSTYNAVVGFRTWITERFGLDINSSGKWKMNSDATNHLQHAIGIVYQFDTEKELTKKGKQKFELYQELQKENARKNDSIANAKQIEENAKLLASRLAKEKENEAIKAQQKLVEDEQQIRRNKIENAIKSLNHVYFDLNSSYLTSSSKNVLSKLAVILNENPSVVLEISSHTDARGTNSYNMWLSDKRVKRTVDYLIQKGIPESQVLGKAFGEEFLVNECDDHTYCTEEKHQQNRRSDFKLIKY